MLGLALSASPGQAAQTHVTARLASDLDRLGATDRFHLGVVLEPDPGWHVYWRHPGGAGLATDVRFELPDGWTAGDLRWPTPISFTQPGGIIGYGYEQPVLLVAEVAAPAVVTSPAMVTVFASWLACKDVCVLGDIELSAELPVDPGMAAPFEGWQASLPAPADAGRLSISATGGPVAAVGTTPMTVWLQWPEDPAAVEFFPDPGPSLKVDNVRTRSRGRLTRVDLDVTRIQGPTEPAAALRSVVATTDRAGTRTGAVISINLE